MAPIAILVVMGIDDVGIRMRLQQGFGDLPPLVACEIARLPKRRSRRPPAALIVSSKPVLPVVGRRRAGRTLELDDLDLPLAFLTSHSGMRLPSSMKIRADEGHVVLAGLASDGSTLRSSRMTGMPAFLAAMTAGNQRLLFARRQEDQVNALAIIEVDVGHLAWPRPGGVRVDEADGRASRPRLSCCLSGRCARDCGFRLRETDLIGVSFCASWAVPRKRRCRRRRLHRRRGPQA